MLKFSHMSGLAQRIRQAREGKGLSIEDCERALRIRRRYLTAIELGDYSQLPDGPASRGFVKNFAKHVGLDAEESLSQFEAEFGVPVIHLQEDVPPPPERVRQESEYTRIAPPDLRWKGDIPDAQSAELDNLEVTEDVEMGVGVTVPEISRLDGTTGRAVVIRPDKDLRAARSSFRLKRGRAVPGLDSDTESPRRISGRPSMYRIGTSPLEELKPYASYLYGFLGIAAALAVLWFFVIPAIGNATNSLRNWWNTPATARPSTPRATPQTRFVPGVTIVAPNVVAPAGNTTGNATAAPTSAGSATPELPAADAPRQQIITVAPLAGGGLRISVSAIERAVIKVIVDGNLVFNGTPAPGITLSWSAERDIVIETANAGAYEIAINDQPKAAPGQRNEKIRLTYAL